MGVIDKPDLDVRQKIQALRQFTRSIAEHGVVHEPPGASESSSLLGLPGAVSIHDARLAALNLLEDAIAARQAEEREARGRERAELSARQSEEFFRRALQDAPIPVIMHTPDGTVLEVSRVWTALSGYGPPEVVNLIDWLGRVCGSNASIVGRRIMEIFRSPNLPLETEIVLTTANGERRRWMLSWTVSNQLRDDQPCAIGMAVDVTDRARAEEALRHSEERLLQARRTLEQRVAVRTRELADSNAALELELEERRETNAHIKTLVQRLVNIQEEERRRIARDIHDHVGQQITALRLGVEILLTAARDTPTVVHEATRVLRLAGELDRSVDSLTWQLRPPTTDNLPLEPSLAQLARDWTERFGFEIHFVRHRWVATQFAPEIQTHVYRIVQEALHNAYKHASATQVCVELAVEGDMALIGVRDNGAGFDVNGASGSGSRTGLGLVGMRERATLCGASLSIESSIGEGTSLSLRVPLSASIWPR